MSIKLKIILGFLVLGVVFLLGRIFITIQDSLSQQFSSPISEIHSWGTASLLTSSVLATSYHDTDLDGISDERETRFESDSRNPDTDGDGFLDGEEVLSGYDPTASGQDEKTVPQNATLGLTKTLIAGIYAGDLNPRKTERGMLEKNLSSVTLTSLADANANLNQSSLSRIRVVDNSVESQEAYLKAIAQVFDEVFTDYYTTYPKILTEGAMALTNRQYEKSRSAYHTMAVEAANNYALLMEIRVPERYQALHQEMLEMFSFYYNNFTALENFQDDPLLGYYGLLHIYQSSSLLPTIVQHTREAVKDSPVTLPHSALFETFSDANETP